MSDSLDTALKAAHRFGRAAKSAELWEAYSAIPAQTRRGITQRDMEIRSKTAVGDGEIALDHLLMVSPMLKLEVLKVADDTLAALKGNYPNYDRLAQFWPPDAATAEVFDFLAQNGCTHLADIARAATAEQPAAPKGPSNTGPDKLTP